ncbi:hypothetical protein HHK36_002409 [Tetracentron sinense]|uniref:Uncharacterized protein n=1 Tax=Tetracentron sinense TaxID=13715 RepID=A0A835DNB7_TETSI|nr:hypothetical protein HHK36_002409 [Tetracentron sinense]
MSKIVESFQRRSFFASLPTNQDLPVSQTNSKEGGLRQRLSAVSARIQPTSSPASSWAFRRSKSMSSIGDFAGSSVRKWWDWGRAWILSRKPTFVRDLEMNEEESVMLGWHNNKGSWRHVFYKVRSEFKRLVGTDNVGLPQTFRENDYRSSTVIEPPVHSGTYIKAMAHFVAEASTVEELAPSTVRGKGGILNEPK